ncbi:MAG: zinc-dependent metalloprotease, partial [Bacteroidales bacterium]
STYGMMNLQRVTPNLIEWTSRPGQGYGDLEEIYGELIGQWSRYEFTGSKLGETMTGMYAEAGYNVLHHVNSTESQLIPFFRFQYLNTHNSTAGDIAANPDFERRILTAGINYKPVSGAVFKLDADFIKESGSASYSTVLNAGIGVMF